MKIIKIDKKENEIQCIPEIIEDLWHLEKIISPRDKVFGSTDRKIKPKNDGEKARRAKLFVELEVKEIKFEEYGSNLRINGVILAGKPEELIELKSHQNIEIKLNEKLKIKKELLKNWQIERLKKAEHESATTNLLTILLDDEEAELAFINSYSITKKALIKEKKRGKRYEQEKSTFFEEILEKIISINPKKILIAGPGFTKENLKKFIEDKKIKGMTKLFVESTNSISDTGFNELIHHGVIEKLEKELQLIREAKKIEEFLSLLTKEKGEYGVKRIKEIIGLGAIKTLLISEKYLIQNRVEAEELMDLAEKNGSEIEIISSKNPQEKIIWGFGGVSAILRYKLD